MNLRDLEYLVALDDLKHFRKAAELCNVSQPTLSGQLKKLEAHLGVQLVERSNRQVILTDVGRDIAERARQLLRDARNIEELALTHANPMSGRLRMGLIPTVAPYVLPLVMGPIKQQWPLLALQLFEGQTSELVERLHKGDLDLLMLALAVPGTEGFDALLLYEEAFLLAVSSAHPLAAAKTACPNDLAHEQVLLLQDGHCLRGQALDICASSGARGSESYSATSLETLRHMVAAGAGVTLIPSLAQIHTDNEAIHYLTFEKPSPSRQIGLLYRSNSSRRSCFRNLAGTIREAVRPHLEKCEKSSSTISP